MHDVVIVEAVRSPIGRRGGGLSSLHSADLLAAVPSELGEAPETMDEGLDYPDGNGLYRP